MNREEVIRMAREAGFRTGELHMQDGSGSWTFVTPIGDGCIVELEKFAALVASAEREKRKEYEMMAECMDMVHQELIQSGVISKEVPPMMVAEAVMVAVRNAVAAEREACSQRTSRA